ncbi:MAG TPA: hypothetical protein VMG38_15645 [Trebonia sp.]|nr:hypothetical protein [Trebonia sp.]
MGTTIKEPECSKQSITHRVSTVTTRKPFHPVPAWDITDEEISEWQHSRSGIPGMILAGYTAAAIRDGKYDSGRELFPRESGAYREVTRETVDYAMTMLMERGMVRKSGSGWYPVVPGRLTPSAHRALGVLLACREALPPALATELVAYQIALDSAHPEGPSASQATTERETQPGQRSSAG